MKARTILLSIILILLVATSCSRRINGATPHRRDRNCGCENLSAPGTPTETICTLPEQTEDSRL
ncbi:MAG: hypothetical protein II751_05305 [Bacteroidales bacterium]|nr:hypothetical protein [Bacteroidales bacterium]MBR6131025.1 hypothetical protein [Bacteroidales bacterium]